MVVTHRLLQNVPLVYGCDSKIIKGKNFESQYVSGFVESDNSVLRHVLGCVQLDEGTGAAHDRAKMIAFERRQLAECALDERAVEVLVSDKAAVVTSASPEHNHDGKSLLDRSRTRLHKPLTMTAPCLSHATDNELADCLLEMCGQYSDRSARCCVFS